MKPTIIPRPQQIINKKGELEKARAEREEAWLLEVIAVDVDQNIILLRTVAGEKRRIFCYDNRNVHPCYLDQILQDFEITPKNQTK